MISLSLGVATAMLVAWAALAEGPRNPPALKQHGRSRSQRQRFMLFGLLGGSVNKVCAHIPLFTRVVLTSEEQRWVGITVVFLGSTVWFVPALALFAPLVLSALIWKTRRDTRITRQRQIVSELPLTVELLLLMVRCGYNVSLALREVVAHLDGPLAGEFRLVLEDVSRGKRLVEALDGVVERTCEEIRPLVWSLSSTERYGSPLSDALERLSLDTRADLERRAEQAAKRLSVQLLFPVAGTTLPAFALLTVAPFIAGTFTTLATNFN